MLLVALRASIPPKIAEPNELLVSYHSQSAISTDGVEKEGKQQKNVRMFQGPFLTCSGLNYPLESMIDLSY